MKKRWIGILCILILLLPVKVHAQEEEQDTIMEISAKSSVLMEASTGKILYEKEMDVQRPPASVTKIMTLLLIFEDLEKNKITLEDSVVVSAHAASMGGSQVFLEEGEVQTVDTLIKCIAVSSANDAAVAVAEHLNGSEEAFVARMNEKAKELGMENTKFVNCCGLDADGHVTTAKDIALMSKELTTKYPDIFNYSTIWMDEFIHKTEKGESVFGLSNTNKMIKSYPGCNGLKTGSTSKAKFCLSATAARDSVSLIAVVMGCPDSKSRSADIRKMFDYGFANLILYKDEEPLGEWKHVDIFGGQKDKIAIHSENSFCFPLLKTEDQNEITKNVRVMDQLKAPVKKNEILGEIEYYLGEECIGMIPIYASEEVKERNYLFSLKILWNQLRLDT